MGSKVNWHSPVRRMSPNIVDEGNSMPLFDWTVCVYGGRSGKRGQNQKTGIKKGKSSLIAAARPLPLLTNSATSRTAGAACRW